MTVQAWLGWHHQTPQRGAVGGEFCRAPPIYLCWWIKIKKERIIREGQPVCSVPSKLVPSYLLHWTFLVLPPVSLHGTKFRGVKGIAPDGVVRKKRAKTQYLGPCFWTLWSSHSHIHGEGVRNWTCDEDPGVFCCADREKPSPSPVGAAVSQDLRDSSAYPGLCSQLYSQTREWSFYRRAESHICCSIAQLCPTLCDPTDCSKSGFPVHHHLPKCVHTHVR